MQPRTALELTLSHSLARPISHSIELSSTCSPLPELLCTFSFFLVHLLVRTFWNSLELAHTRSHSLAHPLARTHSLSLKLCWTRLPDAAKTIQLSLASFTLFLKRIHLLHSWQIQWKHFHRCRRCDRKTKFKGMLPSGWIQCPATIFTRASLPGPPYSSLWKISAKSDYPWPSYCDLTNLWCVRCVGNMFYLFNSPEISFCIHHDIYTTKIWCRCRDVSASAASKIKLL